MSNSSESRPHDRELPLDTIAHLAADLVTRPFARRGVPPREDPIRVIIADDHALVREGIRAVLASAEEVTVVAEAASGPEAVRLARQLSPDVVIMDLEMPEGSGDVATKELVRFEHAPAVLILTMHTEEELLLPLLRAGARGYLAKDAAPRDLVDAVRTVAAGEVYVRPTVIRSLATLAREGARGNSPRAMRTQFDELSDRERDVLRLVAEGFNGPEIGAKLGITAKTVDTYKQRISEKVGLAHRTDYVRFAVALGLFAA
jgi:DNA-binding NarL/FixJ family response regulator